jgi:hypothetical protein
MTTLQNNDPGRGPSDPQSGRERLNQILRFEVKATAQHTFGTINMDKTIELTPMLKDGQVVALSGTASTPDGQIETGELSVNDDGTIATGQAAFMAAVN